jgi:hypothetical protein
MRRDAHLVTVNQDAPSALEGVVDGAARAFEEGFEVEGGGVVDVHSVAYEAFLLGHGEPRCVDDLDEDGDVVGAEEGGLCHCSHGAEVKGPCRGRGGGAAGGDRLRWEDDVHGCAHCLDDLRG